MKRWLSFLTVAALIAAAIAFAQPSQVTMLNAVTTTASSGAVDVAGWAEKSVQVTIGPTCTSYSLVFEGRNAGTEWAQIGNTLTEVDVGANSSKVYDFATNVKSLQARISAISNCTVSVHLHGWAG